MSETGANQVFPGAFRYADDYVFMPLQGASQWDALAHVYYDDQLYNGYPSSNVSVKGATKDVDRQEAKGIAGRGVLLDIARLLDVEWLEQGKVITPEELDRAASTQGVEMRSGDILLFRTGWRKKFLTEKDAVSFMAGEPGLGMACIDWLHQHEVAAVCSDNWAVEVLPGEYDDQLLTVHMVLIRDMGMTLGEILDFEELSADCAGRRRLRVLLLRSADQVHECRGISYQSAGYQVIWCLSIRQDSVLTGVTLQPTCEGPPIAAGHPFWGAVPEASSSTIEVQQRRRCHTRGGSGELHGYKTVARFAAFEHRS